MYYYLYKITNLINNKIYIGVHQTENLDDGYMGSGIALQHAYAKHGINNFKKEILFSFDNKEDMYLKEKQIVNEEFVSRKDTYNLVEGGIGGWKYDKDSEEYKTWRTNVTNSMPNLRDKNSEEYKSWADGCRENCPSWSDDEKELNEWKLFIARHIPQLKDKNTEEYKEWYKKVMEGSLCLKPKESEEYKKFWESMPQCSDKTSLEYKEFLKSMPQTKDKTSPEYIKWLSEIKNSIPQLKDDNHPDKQKWKHSTLKSLPQLKDDNDPQKIKWMETYTKAMKKRIGNVFVKNEKTKQSKTIPKDKLQEYIDGGWVLGLIGSNKGKRWIHNDELKKELFVNSNLVDQYLKDGWEFKRLTKK